MASSNSIENLDITKRNATESPLLRLPAELRNRIYEYAIGGGIIVVDDIIAFPRDGWLEYTVTYRDASDVGNFSRFDGSDKPLRVSRIFALDRTCRQTWSESHKLLFSHNKFHFMVNETMKDFVRHRLTTAQRHAIKGASTSFYILACNMRFALRMGDGLTHPSMLPNLKRLYLPLADSPPIPYVNPKQKVYKEWTRLVIEDEINTELEIAVLC
ncbi:hypothetical protein P280DRAFT_473967 [Massarina eburnea CBS 473.64]|uniref:DUF7730 domain-containing protein n=1 Tax=Massarina eburnea CBS 473.64 TaxID=1395130 RepID=A0A6A6RJM7_9PLEO|nr:hypothetical protein P280DRAFT_473967 [Massarina eburnea CBS 473.64]